jgi:hypothetical protein
MAFNGGNVAITPEWAVMGMAGMLEVRQEIGVEILSSGQIGGGHRGMIIEKNAAGTLFLRDGSRWQRTFSGVGAYRLYASFWRDRVGVGDAFLPMLFYPVSSTLALDTGVTIPTFQRELLLEPTIDIEYAP